MHFLTTVQEQGLTCGKTALIDRWYWKFCNGFVKQLAGRAGERISSNPFRQVTRKI
jgi:hypothetical protein